MADSDEEQERGRSRDKFPKERSDYRGGDRNRSKNDVRERRTWRDDDSSSRRRSRDDFEGDSRRHYSGGGYNRGGRDWSPPPAKRMRRDHWEYRNYPSMMTPYGIRPGGWPMAHDMPPGPHQMPHSGMPGDSPGMGGLGSQGQIRHTMMSFKQFLTQQDDSIGETEAIAVYNEYKAEFKRKQMEEFFEEHKEEDWLVSRYHPKNVKSIKEQSVTNLKSRIQGFLYLLESGRLDGASLSQDNGDDIIKLMDTAVIKMEGGSDDDLLSLDQPVSTENGDKSLEGEGEKRGKGKDKRPSFMVSEPSEEEKQLAEQAKEYGKLRQQSVLGEEEREGSEEPPPPGMDIEPTSTEEENKKDGTAELPEVRERMEGEDLEEKGEATNTKPRPLHLTKSVYIRHIPARVSANDIVGICRTITGYLRIAFADPNPERGYERRGWVTYTHSTDIREVTARLSTSKELTLNCMVNRELTRRIKAAPPAVWSKKAVLHDLNRAVKLVRFLDEKVSVWEYAAPAESADEGEELGEYRSNPVLDFPESVLADEEPSVTMATGDDEEGAISDPGSEIVDKESQEVQVLDQLLWYLRVVHSLDFYNAMVFPSEDCMPHRCCIFTVRPALPSTAPSLEDVNKYCDEMDSKVSPLLVKKEPLSEADMEKFGKKDAEAEVERFIEMNTEKITENKYLCPLSGKKFKGPEFVRKHIFNKHMEKVEAVKQEAEFFNNYLRDPDRPMPLDSTVSSAIHPTIVPPKTPTSDESPSGQPSPWGPGNMFGRGGFQMGAGFPPGLMGQGGYRPRRGGRRGRGRRMVNYRDLDAPEETY